MVIGLWRVGDAPLHTDAIDETDEITPQTPHKAVQNIKTEVSMKKVLALLLILVFALGTIPAFSAPLGQKGASAQALANASDESVFNRVGDWFATRGKSDTEKQQILAERKVKRTAEKVQKEAQRQKKELEKQAKKTKVEAGKKMDEMKKAWGK